MGRPGPGIKGQHQNHTHVLVSSWKQSNEELLFLSLKMTDIAESSVAASVGFDSDSEVSDTSEDEGRYACKIHWLIRLIFVEYR